MDNKAALRRLYFSHPLAVPKQHQLSKNIFHDRELVTFKRLGNATPLLSRRSRTSVPSSLLTDWNKKSKENGNSTTKLNCLMHKSVIRDDMTMIAGFGSKKTRENSTPVGKSRKNGSEQLMSIGRPLSLDAMQKDSCSIDSNARRNVCSATKTPKLFLSNDIKKVNICLSSRISETGSNTSMFQQWGVRKCSRSAPIRYRNNWTNDRLNAEEWPQSGYCFNYKSTMEEIRQRKIDECCMKEAKKAPLLPNPSPINNESTQNTKLKNIQRAECKDIMQMKSNEKGAELKFDLVLSAPKDDWAKGLNKGSVDEIDFNCLCPTMENALSWDWEPYRFKPYDHSSEKKLHDITKYRGSRNAFVLGDIFEAVEEDEAEDNLSAKL